MVVILMLSMHKNYVVHPHLLIFLPVVFCAAAAVYFMRKHL